MPRPVRTTVLVVGRSRRPTADEREIARRVKAGEPHELFLCVDCGLEQLEPVYCGSWERSPF
jgi:hypothetical protein